MPKARPGSSRITFSAWVGGSCQVGTIQKSDVISTGANCDCVRLTQSWSGTALTPNASQPAKKSCGVSTATASCASDSVSNSAITRERCHPSFGGGMPGSPNNACSASVAASASSTDTLSASSASSASLTNSTPLSGTSKRNSNINVTQAVSACALRATLQGSGC